MRNTGRYRRAVYRRRRKGDFRRRRRNTGSSAGVRSPGRRIFNGILWTTSMIMILTLLPAESDAAKKLADLTEGESVLAMAAGKYRISATIRFPETGRRRKTTIRKEMEQEKTAILTQRKMRGASAESF